MPASVTTVGAVVMPLASSAALIRSLNSRSTSYCRGGVVRATSRQMASVLVSDWTPHTLGSSRMTPCHSGSCHMPVDTWVMMSRISEKSWL